MSTLSTEIISIIHITKKKIIIFSRCFIAIKYVTYLDIYEFIVSADDLHSKIICSKSICNDILYPAANLPMTAPLWSDQAGLSGDSRSFSSEFPNFCQNQIFL